MRHIDREATILELAEQVVSLTGSNSKIIFEDLPVDDPTQRCPNITKARKTLDWQPKVPLEVGLKETVAYFKWYIERGQGSTTQKRQGETHVG